MNDTQAELDRRNAAFWNEACGTHLARRTKTQTDYAAFDREYLAAYPFLPGYLDKLSGDVLEIGTGYGTVAQYLSERCDSYLGLDIAEGPLTILKARGLTWCKGNVLSLPRFDGCFDGVVSIGCLHHTGDIPRALAEVYRVTKPGGRLLVMLYNAGGRQAVDRNTKGERAPHTEYTTIEAARALFAAWRDVEIATENGEYRDMYVEARK